MKYDKLLIFGICSVLLPLSISLFVTKYIGYKYYTPMVKLSEDAQELKDKTLALNDINEIISANPFKLQNTKPVQEDELSTSGNGRMPTKDGAKDGSTISNKDGNVAQAADTIDVAKDKLELLGYAKEDKRILALIKLNDDVYVFSSEKEVKGYKVKDAYMNILILINAAGNEIELTMEDMADNLKASAVKDIKVKDSKKSGLLNFKVSREDVIKELKDINSLMRTIYIGPYYNKNEFVGYRISRIRKDSILDKIGLQSGDVIVRINNDTVENPQKLLQLLSKISDVSAVKIDILRRGKKESLFIEII
jgi:general secretion pathway protein C